MKFASHKEKCLWMWALVVSMAIYATLFLGGQLIDFIIDQRLIEQSIFYLFLVLVVTFIFSGFQSSSRRLEHWIYAGVIAVCGMALLRMGFTSAVRSHMFEYGLLSIIVYKALIERNRNMGNVKSPLLTSIVIAGTVGVLDECIQYFLSYRVFDIVDIGFNFLASAIGVLTSFLVGKLQLFILTRRKLKK